jgi:hypothetical protein
LDKGKLHGYNLAQKQDGHVRSRGELFERLAMIMVERADYGEYQLTYQFCEHEQQIVDEPRWWRTASGSRMALHEMEAIQMTDEYIPLDTA